MPTFFPFHAPLIDFPKVALLDYAVLQYAVLLQELIYRAIFTASVLRPLSTDRHGPLAWSALTRQAASEILLVLVTPTSYNGESSYCFEDCIQLIS